MTEPRRPVLRYHGGKFRLAAWVVSHMPPHRVYVESFGGAASVLMHKPRVPGEVYNDVDGDVVNVFRILQDPISAEKLRQRCYLTTFSREEFIKAYEPTDDLIERAARMIVRSYMGFGSDTATREHITGFRMAPSRDGYMGARRKDSGGQTPAVDWATWPASVPSFVERLRGVVIENRPAIDVMRQCDYPDALHYLDPPYVLSTRQRVGKGRGYRFEMTDADHSALAVVARSLSGMVMVSGYRCELYDELYADWPRVEKHHVAQEARRTVETLWINPACAAVQRQTRFAMEHTA